MRLHVLGTAAGGGLPQWNCACPGCAGARAHPERRRRHASLAVRAGPGRWYVVNATPDLGEQIEACTELHPGPGIRHTPVAGVILTDAELDHTLGIARLREAAELDIWSTVTVSAALRGQLRLDAVLTAYTSVRWRPLTRRPQDLDGAGPEGVPDLRVTAIPVSAKRPRYARQDDATAAGAATDAGQDWVVALRLDEPATGAAVLYAPAVGVWSEELRSAAETADCVILDGTFWDDQEPVRSGISKRTATEMGHLPVTGPTGTAERLARLEARCFYTHLNNTNPLNDPHAQEHRVLAEIGLRTATDGMVIDL
ncbi:pyrroloquinoline quinone biosynthesis protein PqqB [Streptacidiphilus sp. EB129]|uniref:pyrroloquinoline quinone biosynthesis protein PqqB n=1 Tax=Streptacidiphilus sp. EB129 TaxID=3156262 RepID=UPI003517A066